jgi:hypothetical protein
MGLIVCRGYIYIYLSDIMYVFLWNWGKWSVWYKMLYHHTTLWWYKNGATLHEVFSVKTNLASYYWNAGKHICKQRKQSSRLIFIHSYCVSRIHPHIFIFKDIDSIFQATLWSTCFQKKHCRTICAAILNIIEQYHDIGE